MSNQNQLTPPPTSKDAIISLVSGIAGFVVPGLGLVGAILAIFFGKKGLIEITASNGALGGESYAKVGRLLGWIAIGIYALAIFFFVLTFALVAFAGVAGVTMATNING
jgi:hypothetical protein